ncbi:hypothetical protein HZY62_10205 [Maribacter polysiphoniae]|uniref:Uncharacterized protein n=1 Tax=Maribacter polysiphoniae TaxID=429344 RepID=A0A316E353_9FLAO|nr:hypothetical protein [Maribacter polysiphoniae]MBD1260959.1 hypothetical protein [Maribacter polysiphoniae]PWK23799.1 hypothetical protein LX92_02366 [Maribacter polysiphoniae]
MDKCKIGILHHDTTQCIQDVKFYLDELQALEDLVHQKADHSNLSKQVHNDISCTISSFLNQLIRDFLGKLREHEIKLSNIIKGKKINSAELDEQKHLEIAQDLGQLKTRIRRLKKRVYRYLLEENSRQRHGFPI